MKKCWEDTTTCSTRCMITVRADVVLTEWRPRGCACGHMDSCGVFSSRQFLSVSFQVHVDGDLSKNVVMRAGGKQAAADMLSCVTALNCQRNPAATSDVIRNSFPCVLHRAMTRAILEHVLILHRNCSVDKFVRVYRRCSAYFLRGRINMRLVSEGEDEDCSDVRDMRCFETCVSCRLLQESLSVLQVIWPSTDWF